MCPVLIFDFIWHEARGRDRESLVLPKNSVSLFGSAKCWTYLTLGWLVIIALGNQHRMQEIQQLLALILSGCRCNHSPIVVSRQATTAPEAVSERAATIGSWRPTGFKQMTTIAVTAVFPTVENVTIAPTPARVTCSDAKLKR